MKESLLLSLAIAVGMVFLFSACKDKHEKLVGSLEGTWTLSEAVTTEPNPENLALPGSGTIRFLACAGQNEGNCNGNFSLDQEEEVPFTYSAYSSTAKNLNILPDFEVTVSNYLTGSWEVLSLEENTLIILGPLQIKKADGTFQMLDVKLTLVK